MFKLEYALEGDGWASASVTLENKTSTTSVSYLSNPLKYLVRSAIAALNPETTPFQTPKSVLFGGEPYGLILTIGLEGGSEVAKECNDDPAGCAPIRQVGLELLETPNWIGDRDAETTRLAGDILPGLEFASEVERVLREVLVEHGVDGYFQLWSEAYFPLAEFAHLRRLLDLPPLTISV